MSDPSHWSVHQIKDELKKKGVDFSNVFEKDDLLALLRKLPVRTMPLSNASLIMNVVFASSDGSAVLAFMRTSHGLFFVNKNPAPASPLNASSSATSLIFI